MKGEWAAVNRFSATKTLKGCWLVDPAGERVCVILDAAIAKQVAAAMNLTTAKERIEWTIEDSLGRTYAIRRET